MKKIILLSICLLFPLSLVMAGNGSFLILKSTYLYKKGNLSSRKILTRKRQAYDVENIKKIKAGKFMFEIIVPEKKTLVNGSGFIVESDEELQKLGNGKVRVYAEIPNEAVNIRQTLMLPLSRMLITGRKERVDAFPNLYWREVNYKVEIPGRYWIEDWSGIYRPDKNAEWLNQSYRGVTKLNLDRTLRLKILQGLIEAGFSMEQVRLSIGIPVKKINSDSGPQTEWIYGNRKVIFQNGKVLRIL